MVREIPENRGFADPDVDFSTSPRKQACFFHGVALIDPSRLLEGTGKRMRHVKLRPGVEIDTGALAGLIGAAYRDIKTRM